MKIIDRFVNDHQAFRKLIRDIGQEAGKNPDEWDQKRIIYLVELFKDHLIIHAWKEETFYVPAVRASLPAGGSIVTKVTMDQLDAEHQVVDGLMDQLERQVRERPMSPSWRTTFQSFIDGLSAHMEKEETELFPFSEGLLGKERLEAMANELNQRKSEAPSLIHQREI